MILRPPDVVPSDDAKILAASASRAGAPSGGAPSAPPGLTTGDLSQRIRELDERGETETARKRTLRVVGCLGLLAAPPAYFLFPWWLAAVLAGYGLVALLASTLIDPGETEWEKRYAQSALLLADDKLTQQQDRAMRQYRNHDMDLKRFYGVALGQSRFVFWIGIVAILIGLGIAVGTMAAVGTCAFCPDGASEQEGNEETSQEGNRQSEQQGRVAGAPDWNQISTNALVAILGAISSLLSGYVATIYLRMHTGASAALNDFHSRLVLTHRVHIGNLLASLVSDKSLRDQALADMARELAR